MPEAATFAKITCLNMRELKATPTALSPYTHFICPNAVNPSMYGSLDKQFPRLPGGGQYLASDVKPGPVFKKLLVELESPEVIQLFSDKLGLDLLSYPQMITVRGVTRAHDGRVHTDSTNRVATVLLYPNEQWPHEGGSIRVLRSPRINDFTDEILPTTNNLLAFRRSENSFHGHLPYVGKRQSIQIQWMSSVSAYKSVASRLKRNMYLKLFVNLFLFRRASNLEE